MSAAVWRAAHADLGRTQTRKPDGLPIVGAAPEIDGLWYATGHGRNGILLAGITGLIVSQLVAREPTHEDVSLLSPERYWRW